MSSPVIEESREYGIYVVTGSIDHYRSLYPNMPMHVDYMRDKHGRIQASKRVIIIAPTPGPTGSRLYEIRPSNYPPANRVSDLLFPIAQNKELDEKLQQLVDLGIIKTKPTLIPISFGTTSIRVVWSSDVPITERILARVILDGSTWSNGQMVRVGWAHQWSASSIV